MNAFISTMPDMCFHDMTCVFINTHDMARERGASAFCEDIMQRTAASGMLFALDNLQFLFQSCESWA